MKTWLLFFLLSALPLRAALVRMSLTGRLTSVSQSPGAPVIFAVGDPWSVEVTYEHPTAPVQYAPDFDSYFYYPTYSSVNIMISGVSWQGSALQGEFHSGASVMFGGQPYEYGSLSAFLGPPPSLGAGQSGFYLTFSGAPDIVGDLASLPDSLEDWRLDTAAYQGFAIEALPHLPGALRLSGTVFDTFTIQVIPEPSTAGLAGVVAITMLGRRRRVRA